MAHDSSLSPPMPSEQPAAMEQRPAVVTSQRHYVASAHFEKQPPDNMRKSNFFHFIISLYDSQQHRVKVQKAVFKDFYDIMIEGQEYRNGLIYKLLVVYSDGTQKEEELCIRLIDSSTKRLIPYEGTNKNPDFRRVLLTHELICSRCLERRSCGNKNDTPSDPIILDSFRLKIFAKCNQNCLKNAGNPKDSRRRFQVAVHCIDSLNGPPIACSDSMFVHNNSKHGRRPIYRENIIGDGKPCIVSIYPSEGWTTGGTRITVIGINFFDGLDVVFGTVPVQSEVMSPNAIAVRTPPATMTGEVDVTLIFRASGAQFCLNNPGKFLYTAPDDHTFENSFCRIERVVRQQDDPDELPKDIILQRAAELLESCFMTSRQSSSAPIPFGQGPFAYPHSPALIGSNGIFLFTPQPPLTPRLGAPNGGILPIEGPNSFGYMQGPPNDSYQRQPGYSMSQTAFPFPDISNHGGDPNVSIHNEIKTESHSSPGQNLHKPQPLLANGSMVMPFSNISYDNGGSYIHSNGTSMPLNHGQMNNANNNNSVTTDTSITSSSCHNNHLTNSLSYMSRLLPGPLPSSPGFFMTHSFSPLPTTPTGSLNSSMLGFTNSLLSPTKGGRPLKPPALPVPSTSTNSMSLPSPQFGSSFTFPPITPTALIAPIIPDLITDNAQIQDPLSVNSTATCISSTHSNGSSTPSRKRKADGSPAEL